MNRTIIIGKENNGKDLTYKVVEGYTLPHGLFAHKQDKHWVLSDYNSGMFISNAFHTFAEVKKYAQNINMKELSELRSTERYKKGVKIKDKFYKKEFFGDIHIID